MANEPADMIMPMQREMCSEMNERFSRVETRLGRVEQKLEKIEDAEKNVRQALVADTMMSRLIAGDFEERIAARREARGSFRALLALLPASSGAALGQWN